MWWNAPAYAGTITTALGHLNEARESEDGPAVERCDLYFKALNQLWNGFGHLNVLEHADTRRLIALLQNLTPDRSSLVLRSQQLADVVALDPPVMNHYRLNKHGYRPGAAISPALLKKATEEHADLKRRTKNQTPDHSDGRALKSLAEFLYVVRSNIAHGEKTPYGPDLEKSRRDEQVAATLLPLQELLLDELLDRPSEKLVAYGTLRPGHANAGVLAGLRGEWQDCTIRGKVEALASGLAEFRWAPNGALIPAMMLTSRDLEHEWDRLDRFEGARYRRWLIPVQVAGGESVASCYVVR
jgi:gamma-glutamylcyclotransferase (GGCT)/AIG2-like uncharacterized protein YtfP